MRHREGTMVKATHSMTGIEQGEIVEVIGEDGTDFMNTVVRKEGGRKLWAVGKWLEPIPDCSDCIYDCKNKTACGLFEGGTI